MYYKFFLSEYLLLTHSQEGMDVLDRDVYFLCSVCSVIRSYMFNPTTSIVITLITPALSLSSFLPAHPLKSHFVDKHSLAFPRSCSHVFTMFLHNKEMQDNHEN